MLIISRKPDESIVITTDSGDEVVISVLEITGQKVRLGFDADDSVTIDRAELLEDE